MMKTTIILLFTVLIFSACEKEVTDNYYGNYEVSALLTVDTNYYWAGDKRGNLPAAKFLYKSKKTGDIIRFDLRADTIMRYDTVFSNQDTLLIPLDTTRFTVAYYIKESIVQYDSGYSLGSQPFISEYRVK